MAFQKKGASKGGASKWQHNTYGEPIQVEQEGTIDVRFTLSQAKTDDEATAKQLGVEVGKYGAFKVSVEMSADGERFRREARLHPAILTAVSASGILDVLASGTWDENGNWTPPAPQEKKAAKVKKASK